MRIDEDKIFGAYMQSLNIKKETGTGLPRETVNTLELVSEKKKSIPPWLKDKKDDKKSDKKSDKKKKKLPPWLKKKGDKVVKENHDTYPDDLLTTTVERFLDILKGLDLEAYKVVEGYIEKYFLDSPNDIDSGEFVPGAPVDAREYERDEY